MKMTRFATTATVGALTAMATMSSYAVQEQCPSACPAAVTTTIYGTQPCSPHATFFFDFIGQPHPGDGSEDCQRTCHSCTQQVQLLWNSNGQPCCLQVDTGDAGGMSTPTPKFNRMGNLIANCDEARVYSIALLGDCNLASPWEYTKSLTLYCGCD